MDVPEALALSTAAGTGWKGKENVPVQEVVTESCSDLSPKTQFSSCLSSRVPSPLTKEADSLKLCLHWVVSSPGPAGTHRNMAIRRTATKNSK